MATHSPIIAAQFEPYERIILEWGSDGFVTASKGVAPKGDEDPSPAGRRIASLNLPLAIPPPSMLS